VLPADSGWVLSFAVDINDRGQIVGGGFHNGAFHAFLLSPSKDDDD
jgi:probable HAF family extracellular repeat protein